MSKSSHVTNVPRSSTPTDFHLDEEKAITHLEESEHTLKAWLVVLGAGAAFFCTSGLMNAFGLFQEYYASTLMPDKSAFTISWIGSFATAMMFLGSGFSGVLFDKTGPTALILIGTVGMLIAIFLLSLCKLYYQIFLCQGLLLGLSMSFLVTPSIATLANHFNKNRGLATGIAISGSSLGGVIWPIALNQLLTKDGVSFAWTIRIIGFIMIPLLLIPCLTIRAPPTKATSTTPNPPSSTLEGTEEEKAAEAAAATTAAPPKKKLDVSILKSTPFRIFLPGIAIFYLAMFAPFFFIPTYAVSELSLSTSFAFYLPSMLNGASMFGRILPGILADRVGHFNVCAGSAVLAGVVAFTMTAADSKAGVVVWALAYGFASGAMLSQQMTCAAALSTPATRGTAMGLAMVVSALAGLFGSPIAGALIETPGGFLSLAMYSGATLTVGAGLVWLARLKINSKLWAKV